MQRLTFAGSAFLTLIYFLPSLLNIGGNIPYLVTQFFGGHQPSYSGGRTA